MVCHDHLAIICMNLHHEHPTPPRAYAYASYRLARERDSDRAQGTRGDPGARASRRARARRGASRVFRSLA
jgi:hypothetical protein